MKNQHFALSGDLVTPGQNEWGNGKSSLRRLGDRCHALLEAFVLFCSNRFVTWGSVHQAKMHVVEFMRWTSGVIPPDFHKTGYTVQKLKRPLRSKI